jgi:eukaryotic-like serine/threonine-protein kinase
MNLVVGSQLGHFTLERQIGAGGMGSVWAARDDRNGGRMALKILRLSETSSADVQRTRLLREAHATRSIAHPAIVPVQDVFSHTGNPVLVMELLQGETLRHRLLRERQLSVSDTGRLLAPIAEALGAAHAAGIVHRDLKPENIFIEETGGIRLLDFGVARFFEPPEPGNQVPLTDLGTLIGTLAYMAPEQALRPSECDQQVDVWALGVILYETLSGCRPIEGGNGPATMRQLLVGGLTPLKVLMPDLPEQLTELVGQMLSRTPERRPSDLRRVSVTLRVFDHV